MRETALVLIVDDSVQNLQVAGDMLVRAGYKVALAKSGIDALEFVKKQKPDLVLLDIMMPEMDGFKVCQILKEDLETRYIPVVFLTAKNDTSDIVKAFELGGADYICKPVNERELLARVTAHVDLVKLQNILREKNRRLIKEIRLRKQREKDLVIDDYAAFSSILADGVAHELNNLLQVILGYGEMVAERLTDDPELLSLQQSVLDAGQKTSRFVKQLMAICENKNRKPLTELDLRSFFQQRSSLFSSIFPERITFNLTLPGEKLYVKADPAELTRAILNLLTNARNAIQDNGAVSIDVYLRKYDEAEIQQDESSLQQAVIRISDTGIGLNREMLSQANTPNFIMGQSSSGIGLGVVKTALRHINGTIVVDSNPGAGTSCTVSIPLHRLELSSMNETERQTPELPGIPQNATVLIAEDDEKVALLEKRMLEQSGFTVIPAHNGSEALELFEKHKDEINAAILDIGLPGKSGVEVGHHISENSSIPVIYCTAYNDRHLEDLADRAPVLQKPFERNEVIRLLQKLIKLTKTAPDKELSAFTQANPD